MRTALWGALGLGLALSLAGIGSAGAAQTDNHNTPANGCKLQSADGRIKHIVHIQFDNVHLRRNIPNVPSDIEQMPNLLDFIEDNGTILGNHHTQLISHTAGDFVTTLTGVYGEKMGISNNNTVDFFNPDGSVGHQSQFAYWTDFLEPGVPNMVDQRGKTHPAPWVAFTRAGCDLGAFAFPNIEFENTTTDVDNVFGPSSPQHNEVAADSASKDPKTRNKPAADFEGIAIHCAQGSKLCANGQPDLLPDEPGGYTGFQALFGNVFVAPAITGGGSAVLDLDGNPVQDATGNPGFPGFNPTPSQALGYLAQLLEAGVPVVYAELADVHDNHNFAGAPIPNYPDDAFGPGEANYVFQLKAYDKAFGQFFARLKKHGITKENTLFIFTSDENDHFDGTTPIPANCDGVTTPCTYPPNHKGEVNANLNALFAAEQSDTTPFGIDFDSAPGIWVTGLQGNHLGGQTGTVVRTIEREAGQLFGFNALHPDQQGNPSKQPLAQALADQTEMRLLHMVPNDPRRTPNFILFANPDYFLLLGGPARRRSRPASP
jgi:hypothetical protein